MNHRTNTYAVNLMFIILRILTAFLIISIFIPALNPARVSELINKNLSLFTSGFAYSTVLNGFKRALSRGWIEGSVLNLLFYSSTLSCLSIIVLGIGACLTLGESRLKKTSTYMMSIGSVTAFIGIVGVYLSYNGFTRSPEPGRINPMLPSGIYIIPVAIIVIGLLSFVINILLGKPSKKDKYQMKPKYFLFLMFLPFIVLCFLFSYLPLWGWRYSFFNYKPGFDLSADVFAGFKWFTYLFENPATRADIARVLTNTLAMSGLGIATSWLPMAFAIFLTEIKAVKFKRTVQTLTTIPNFISWVLVYAFAFALFSTDGFMNRVLIDLGVIDEAVNFLLSPDHIWLKMLAWGTWKGLGWSAIIYLAAISSIDTQLYEAAIIDGAGRFKRMWYITVPGLLPTYFVLLLLAIAGILSNGMDQYLVFKNAANKNTIEVLDLYVYILGLGGSGGTTSNIPLATVVGMMKSLISVTLLFMANGLSKLVRKESII
jgi:putative aldouronate transport system permease protein